MTTPTRRTFMQSLAAVPALAIMPLSALATQPSTLSPIVTSQATRDKQVDGVWLNMRSPACKLGVRYRAEVQFTVDSHDGITLHFWEVEEL